MPCHSAKANSPRPGKGTLLHALGQKAEHPWLQQGCSAASYPSQSSQHPREGCYHHSGQHKHAKCNRSSPPFEFFPSRSVPCDVSLPPPKTKISVQIPGQPLKVSWRHKRHMRGPPGELKTSRIFSAVFWLPPGEGCDIQRTSGKNEMFFPYMNHVISNASISQAVHQSLHRRVPTQPKCKHLEG